MFVPGVEQPLNMHESHGTMNTMKGQVILQMYFGNMLSKCLSFQSIKLQIFISSHYCSDFTL